MEIEPATFAQLRQSRGRWVEIPAEYGTVSRDLRDINPDFRLRCNANRTAYVVYQVLPSGKQSLVTTATACDQRLVRKVRRIVHPSYDLLVEMDRVDAGEKRAADHARRERVGEVGERLLHGMQQDLAVQNTVFLGDEVGKRRRRKGLK